MEARPPREDGGPGEAGVKAKAGEEVEPRREGEEQEPVEAETEKAGVGEVPHHEDGGLELAVVQA